MAARANVRSVVSDAQDKGRVTDPPVTFDVRLAAGAEPALRERGRRTLPQTARAVVGLDRTGMPSCPGAANGTSPPRPFFPEGSMPRPHPPTKPQSRSTGCAIMG